MPPQEQECFDMAGEYSETKISQEFSMQNRVNRHRDDFLSPLVYDMKTPLVGADRILELFVQEGSAPSVSSRHPCCLNCVTATRQFSIW
jgi:hypothetical protein